MESYPLTDCDGRSYHKDSDGARTYAPRRPSPEAERDARAASLFLSATEGVL